MAIITASPNPVGVYSNAVGASTTVTWDTQLPLLPGGKVFVSINGGAETQLPGQAANGARTGSLSYKVTHPNSYAFVLRRSDNQAELARVVVTTYDMRNEMIAGFAAPYIPALRPQMITNVSVKVGVDTVRISFNTVRPTIPLTTLMDASGAKIDARFPLFGGLQTSHEAMFGVETPLALEAKHTFRIVAAGPTGNKNSPKEAVFNGEFITGKRRIDIFFDTVDVHDDGDPWPSGSGEFRFAFGAGDAETTLPMGEPWPEYGPDDISDDDPPVSLNQQITIPQGPRQLWVQVVGAENDATMWPWDWGIGLGRRPTFKGPGSGYAANAAAENAWVTSVFDIGSEPDSWTMSFDMATGDHPVDFVVSCRLAVEIAAGSVITPKMFKPVSPLKFTTVLEDAGTVAYIAARGGTGQVQALALGADGALHHRTMALEGSRRDGSDWGRIDLPGEGTVSVAASLADKLELVFRDSDGSVSYRSHDARRPRSEKWRKLGGNFRYVVPAVESSKGKDAALLIFGVADDGGVHVRDGQGGGNWDRLGDQAVVAIAPVSSDASGTSLFAAGTDGTLLHFSRQRGRWKSEAVAPLPAKVRTLLLTATLFDRGNGKGRGGGDLVVGALGEDHTVWALRWPNYPAGTAEARWEELGPIQDMALAGTQRTGSKPSRAAKRPAKARAR